MITIGRDEPSPSALERFGLDLLLSTSRLVRADPSVGSCTQLVITTDDRHVAPSTLGDPAHLFAVGEGRVTVSRGAIESLARIAARTVEAGCEVRDRHGRVPSEVNELVAGGMEQRPVVSEAGRAFREAVRRAAGRRVFRTTAPWPSGGRWAAALTHDLDIVSFWPLFSALRVAELARKGDWSRVGGVLRALTSAWGTHPVVAALRAILETEARAGARSTWFVLAGTPTMSSVLAGDVTYRVDDARTRELLSLVTAAGGEIGLHGSMATLEHETAFTEQRATLARVTATSVSGVRQHFLRMRDDTFRRMRATGFSYDSTLGFADRPGFRVGVADILPSAWDGAATLPDIAEAPFCWMDRALSKYQGREEPEALVESALDMADRCSVVEGLWNGIWHPNLTPALGFPGTRDTYDRIVRGLADRGATFVTLQEAVEWRRASSEVTVKAIAADGTPVFANRAQFDVPVADERDQPRGVARGSDPRDSKGPGR